jgi:3-deoxy-D-manno-octulosonic-acid transferase
MRRLRYASLLAFSYTLIMRLAVPFLVLRLLWRSRGVAGYRRKWWLRLGWGLPRLDANRTRPIWIHAVSVGETLAVSSLIDMLLMRYPKVPILVTSTTPTGAAQVARLFGHRVDHSWMPFDTPGAVKRFLRHFQPRLVALVETEIWPNLLRESEARDIPVFLLNARMSARSARGYARVAPLAVPALRRIGVIAAQHRSDARRFRALGARRDGVQVVGSVKYDLDLPGLMARCSGIREQLGAELGHRRIFLAASTHPGEEEGVVTAFRQWAALEPEAVLVLAPRHPERVPGLLAGNLLAGLPFQRRSEKSALAAETRVLLWDTLGELGAAMGLAEVVFVGGSLIPHGGHNPLEASVWGAPVITGQHFFNFEATYRELLAADAAIAVDDEEGLAAALLSLVRHPATARRMGAAGRRVVDAHRGALTRQFKLLAAYLD